MRAEVDESRCTIVERDNNLIIIIVILKIVLKKNDNKNNIHIYIYIYILYHIIITLRHSDTLVFFRSATRLLVT